VRDPAPPDAGEGPHALWHVSEDDAIARFEPHLRPEHDADEPLVWAVDTRHLPLYWFPRECPRATFWAHAGTSEADVARFLAGGRGRRVHVVERAWLDRMRTACAVAYRLPEATFEPYEPAGGYWVSRAAVDPVHVVELGDLVALHERAGIELRAVDELLPLWDAVVASSLEYSGIRLRNATLSA
jgi:uncharacterized protein DUF6886